MKKHILTTSCILSLMLAMPALAAGSPIAPAATQAGAGDALMFSATPKAMVVDGRRLAPCVPMAASRSDQTLELAPMAGSHVAAGTVVTLTAAPADGQGTAPFTYEWTDAWGNTLATEAALTLTAEAAAAYTATITDAEGLNGAATVNVTIDGPLAVATFEEATLEPESAWNGTSADTPWHSGSFCLTACNFEFYWSGYAISSETASEAEGYQHQYRSAAGGAYEGSNFAMFYPTFPNSEKILTVTNHADGDVVAGMWVTNSAYAVTTMRNGDAFGVTPFAEGDFFTLTATGYDTDGAVTGQLTFDLADFRAETPEADRYILDSWKWMSLEGLGRVRNIMFSFSSSQASEWGNLLPEYLAIDNLGAPAPASLPTLTANNGSDWQLTAWAAAGRLNVATGLECPCTAELYGTDGRLMASFQVAAGAATVDCPALRPGSVALLRVVPASRDLAPRTLKLAAR